MTFGIFSGRSQNPFAKGDVVRSGNIAERGFANDFDHGKFLRGGRLGVGFQLLRGKAFFLKGVLSFASNVWLRGVGGLRKIANREEVGDEREQ
jgi:hypothetical protein